MPMRNVVLTNEQANVVQSLVKSGRSQNASDDRLWFWCTAARTQVDRDKNSTPIDPHK
jgi:hypothetical protein